MNLIKTLLFPGSGKPKKQKKSSQKPKKNIGAWLLNQLTSIPLEALKAKWNRDLWDPRK